MWEIIPQSTKGNIVSSWSFKNQFFVSWLPFWMMKVECWERNNNYFCTTLKTFIRVIFTFCLNTIKLARSNPSDNTVQFIQECWDTSWGTVISLKRKEGREFNLVFTFSCLKLLYLYIQNRFQRRQHGSEI